MKLEINHWMLSDSPYNKENKSLFMATSRNYKDLINDIRHGTPTSYLVSGYRGAGKTSFIRRLEELLAQEQPKDVFEKNSVDLRQVVFVHVGFSKYQSKTFLLRKLIRGLYLNVQELHSFQKMKRSLTGSDSEMAMLLEQLYEKTFYDTSSGSSGSNKTERITTISYNIRQLIEWAIYLVLFCLFLLNIFYFRFALPPLGNLAGLAGAVFLAARKAVNITRQHKRTAMLQEEFNRKSMYDDEIAEHHFYRVLEHFYNRYKVVFVLDELDKVADSEIDELLKEMKPYLVSGIAFFIVVAGQRLYYKYRRSKSEDDALLSSIFTKCIHVPLLSREEFRLVFDQLVHYKRPPDTGEQRAKNAYIDFLVFQSKRIPRKFLGLVRENISWENGAAYLDINVTGTIYESYTQILDIIDGIDDTEIAAEGFEGAMRDFFVMQLFLKAAKGLSSGKQGFYLEQLRTGYE